MNWYVQALGLVGIRQGIGAFIAVDTRQFWKTGMFREDIAVGEDADFIRRLGDQGRVVHDTTMPLLVSARRFAVEKPIVFALKCIFWAVLRLLRSRASGMRYSWSRYPDHLATQDQEFLSVNSGGPNGIPSVH